MADQLKACPMCACTDIVIHVGLANFDDVEIECQSCYISTASFDDGVNLEQNKAEAIAAWNTRAEPVGVPTVQAGDEPTEAMYAAAESLFDDPHLTNLLCNSRGAIRKFYCAMRSAAPSQPVAGKPSHALASAIRNVRASERAIGRVVIGGEIAGSGLSFMVQGLGFAIDALEKAALLTTANAGKDAE